MDIQLDPEVLEVIRKYRLPRYAEIPDVGLYLNQVAKFINGYMEPFCEMNITESMISNYVKKHLVKSPKKKQYDREQLANLLFIAFAKPVLSLSNIELLFELQKQTYESRVAYDYFCSEFENVLQYVFGIRESMARVSSDDSDAKLLFQNVIITLAHKIYLDHCFRAIQKGRD